MPDIGVWAIAATFLGMGAVLGFFIAGLCTAASREPDQEPYNELSHVRPLRGPRPVAYDQDRTA